MKIDSRFAQKVVKNQRTLETGALIHKEVTTQYVVSKFHDLIFQFLHVHVLANFEIPGCKRFHNPAQRQELEQERQHGSQKENLDKKPNLFKRVKISPEFLSSSCLTTHLQPLPISRE